MINTRSVFREERKSTPVQDVTTTSAQINHAHAPHADMHVGGNSISWALPSHTHTHTNLEICTYTQRKAVVYKSQSNATHSTQKVNKSPKQTGKE